MSGIERSGDTGLRDPYALTPAQDRAVAALLSEPTLEQAAKAARVSTATLRRWRDEPAFVTAYHRARTAQLDAATVRLGQAAHRAVETLTGVMEDPEARHGDRIRAAVAVLDMAYRAAEMEDIAQRLEMLESFQRVEQGTP